MTDTKTYADSLPSGSDATELDYGAAESSRSDEKNRDSARYEILGEHARGGLGRILKAPDKQLGRSVAIKELLRGAGRSGQCVR